MCQKEKIKKLQKIKNEIVRQIDVAAQHCNEVGYINLADIPKPQLINIVRSKNQKQTSLNALVSHRDANPRQRKGSQVSQLEAGSPELSPTKPKSKPLDASGGQILSEHRQL